MANQGMLGSSAEICGRVCIFSARAHNFSAGARIFSAECVLLWSDAELYGQACIFDPGIDGGFEEATRSFASGPTTAP